MKLLRLTGILLLFIIGITAILSFFLPVKQTVTKTVTIQAPAVEIYKHIAKLERFNEWTVWGKTDSSVQYTITGTDGEAGATSSWSGNPELSGKGSVTIVALEPGKKVEQQFHFTEPRSSRASSVFTLDEASNATTVTWTFEMTTPRPWNVFNLFYSMDKQMGKDFEDGLAALKAIAEKEAGTEKKVQYTVKQFDFSATTYATIRQEIKMADITSFFSKHLSFLFTEAGNTQANPGIPCGLYYKWDDKKQLTDMAAAIPVDAGSRFDNAMIKVETIPASKAVYADYYGPYEKLREAYTALQDYARVNNLKQKPPFIEQYITDPGVEKDSTKWLTKVIMLVE